jgi:hypothetical protein
MSTFLTFGRDTQGYNAFAPARSKDIYKADLATGVAASIIVPSNHEVWIVVFSIQPGTDVWVDLSGATAAGPGSGAFVSTTSELNPGSRIVLAGDTISCITTSAASEVSVALYAVSYP